MSSSAVVERGARARLRLADIDRARSSAGQTVLLFLTDRCPVNCAHCSVDSRPDSPTVTDRAFFDDLVEGIARDRAWLVGISGGEPFVERWGLERAVARLRAAGKQLAVHTSGVWGTKRVAAWIPRVLADIETVILSTDNFHDEKVAGERFETSLRTIADSGAWTIVQVVDTPGARERAETLVAQALGDQAHEHCELRMVPLLPFGRASGEADRILRKRKAADLGPCDVLCAPVIRYDGRLSPCCNERVCMGEGPESLRPVASSGESMQDHLARLDRDPMLRIMRLGGPRVLSQLPYLEDLASQSFRGICDACWVMRERFDNATASDQALTAALASLLEGD